MWLGYRLSMDVLTRVRGIGVDSWPGVRDLDEVFRRRELVLAFAKRDISVRYRSSLLGWLWSLAQPLANLVFFSIMFTMIFRVQAPPLGNGHGASYPAFLMCGIATWTLFASLQRLSIDTLRTCFPLMGKVAFPGWAPIIGAQLVQAVQVLMEFVVLVLLFVFLGNFGWTWLLALPILLGTLLFGMGIGLMVSILSAHLGDVREIVTTVVMIMYFATPVLYPLSMVQGHNHILALVVKLNPMSWFVQSMHDVMYSLIAPSPWVILSLVIGGAATLWIGFKVFVRASRNLAEVL